MAVLGPPSRPVVLPTYPHMLIEDRTVWSRFLCERGGLITGVWYDVHVGEPVAVPLELPPEMLKVSEGVSRKRIDVVALMGGVYHVIEVKPWGSYVALGQVLVYWRLFKAEFPDAAPSLPFVVCSSVDPDCADDYEEHGVGLYRVTLG